MLAKAKGKIPDIEDDDFSEHVVLSMTGHDDISNNLPIEWWVAKMRKIQEMMVRRDYFRSSPRKSGSLARTGRCAAVRKPN